MVEHTSVIAISDLHVNSTVAICTPTVQLDDKGTYYASYAQSALWECWLDFIEQVKRIDGKRILIVNGDLGELDTQYRTDQLITRNKATVFGMLVDVLEPLANEVDQVVIMRGTHAHTGESAWLEEMIADDFSNVVRESEHVASWYHMQRQIGSLLFDVAHHWNGNNPAAAIRKAAQTELEYFHMGMKAPDVVLRAHKHTVMDSGENFAPIHFWSTPAWTLKTEYAYRIGMENKAAEIGGLIFNCDGAYQIPERIIYEPKQETRIWQIL